MLNMILTNYEHDGEKEMGRWAGVEDSLETGLDARTYARDEGVGWDWVGLDCMMN